MIKPEDFTDVTYAVEEDAFAIITINRPERLTPSAAAPSTS